VLTTACDVAIRCRSAVAWTGSTAARAAAPRRTESAGERLRHLTCKKIGERLFDARDRAGLTLRALGEKAGVSWSTISAIEKGRQAATVETTEGLAVALGVRPCWLAFGEGSLRTLRQGGARRSAANPVAP
jgi:DNA-binding XRE family transcriptional regulator